MSKISEISDRVRWQHDPKGYGTIFGNGWMQTIFPVQGRVAWVVTTDDDQRSGDEATITAAKRTAEAALAGMKGEDG